ncbi:O-methyltransferase, family 2 [Syntrophobacter sp. SbD1]|nr:O-methyltransferase, family 2 [Syntrophobacter sp. SbD1]
MEEKEDVMAVARAFMRSRIILTAAELDLFTIIDESSTSAEKIAERFGLDRRALERLLDSLAALGLLSKEGGAYSLTGESAPYSSKHPTSQLPMLLHMNSLWGSWSDLTKVVKEGSGLGMSARKPMDLDSRREFIGAMHVVGRTLSEEIAGSLDLSGWRKLLDIGGGSGTYTISLLKRNPELQAVLFDLKDVIEMARERLSAEGLLERVELIPGDFYTGDLPKGCDLALLSAIIHQNSPLQNLELYRKVYRSLSPGGMLLIRDHIMSEDRTLPPEGALFAINMLVNTRGGDTYTFEDVAQGLKQAGFVDPGLIRSGERMDCVVSAIKPV